jgi:hypothetical protein
MKLKDLALLAEIIAATGVVISLVFVGIQVREGNRETRAVTIQAATDSKMRMVEFLVLHASTLNKVLTDSPLNPGEESQKALLLAPAFHLTAHPLTIWNLTCNA